MLIRIDDKTIESKVAFSTITATLIWYTSGLKPFAAKSFGNVTTVFLSVRKEIKMDNAISDSKVLLQESKRVFYAALLVSKEYKLPKY